MEGRAWVGEVELWVVLVWGGCPALDRASAEELGCEDRLRQKRWCLT